MLVVWVCFAWNSSLVGGPISAEYDVLDLVVPSGTVLNQVLSTVVRTMRATVPGFLEGIFNAVNHARGGHQVQFLLGEIRYNEGWWYYFPVALMVKLTLPFLVLVVVALITCVRRPPSCVYRSLYPALGALSILSVGMFSEINIGVRHILPMLPLLAVAASSMFERRGRHPGGRIVLLSCVLVGSQLIASSAAHPDYLALSW